ncbi:MAG: hypothetical protein OXH65_09150 [Paracoccaceae bacterium]|nr:hypothetical protein [Paracoccaceae bacterium]MDE2675258.1 hypothetical protein [Paracoccaceae bacterium]
MPILLKDIWPIENPDEYKIHFASRNYGVRQHPLDMWMGSKERWKVLQEHSSRNDFNQPYIFSLMQFYHETDIWLFGGVFTVMKRKHHYSDVYNYYTYEVELSDFGKEFIGRLKIRSSLAIQGNRRVRMMPHYHRFEVHEILQEPYCI